MIHESMMSRANCAHLLVYFIFHIRIAIAHHAMHYYPYTKYIISLLSSYCSINICLVIDHHLYVATIADLIQIPI